MSQMDSGFSYTSVPWLLLILVSKSGRCCHAASFYKDALPRHDDVIKWKHLLSLCAGNSPVTGEFPSQRPVTRSFDVFFDLRLNKRLSKQSWGWWFQTLSRPLWRHINDKPYRFGPEKLLESWTESMAGDAISFASQFKTVLELAIFS